MNTLAITEVSHRQREIVRDYVHLLDKHIADLKDGKASRTQEIGDFADQLHVHPRHLSNTIHEVLGKSPCDLYEERLTSIAKEMLITTNMSVSQIARHLFYDPSNFVKFFKRFTGTTPKKFRDAFFSQI